MLRISGIFLSETDGAMSVSVHREPEPLPWPISWRAVWSSVDMAYMQLKEDLPAGFQMLLIASNSVMTGASSAEVTHMETPLKVQELIQTIHFMEEDAARRRRKRREQPRQRSPEERAMIQQAKELLMKSNHISEDEAHKYLLRTSMQSGRNLFETAQMVLLLKNK